MQTDFGQFLKQKRQDKNLTQKQLASKLFVSESLVSKWERGGVYPDITLLPILSETLGVTEHELITASVDKKARQDKLQARKGRVLSKSWELFFYIGYAIALLTCFICNLAINKKLDWFFIVLFSLLLAFSFTNLPKFIKSNALVKLLTCWYVCLSALLLTCAIYTNGNWFFISAVSILLGLVCVFAPIFIARYKVFERIRKYNEFVSVAIDFVLLNILLIIIDSYCLKNGYTTNSWYIKLGLSISLVVYIILNGLMCVKFIKTNKLIKTSIILWAINLLIYGLPNLIKVKNASIQAELNDLNIFKANFSVWNVETIENNVNLIVAICITLVATAFLAFGVAKAKRQKTK